MTRIKVRILIWNEYNLGHIKKHLVIKEEVEIATLAFIYHEKSHNNRYILVGRSGKRILSVVVRRLDLKTYYVVTARDSDKRERRKLYERENIQNI